MNRLARARRIGGITILLAAALVAAVLLGLPPRPTLAVGAVDATSIRTFVVAVLRLALTVALWYLLLATALELLARLPGLGRRIRPLADRLTAVGAGLLLRRVLAGTVVAGVALPAGAGATGADETPVMVPVDPDASPVSEGRPSDADPARHGDDEPPTMSRHPSAPTSDPSTLETTAAPDAAPGEPPQMRLDPVERPSPPTPEPPTPEPPTTAAEPAGAGGDRDPTTPPRPGSHRVQRGESFWSIARSVVASLGGDADDPREVAPLWQRLVDTNADRLVDPSNPDLLHTGQQIDIPPLER